MIWPSKVQPALKINSNRVCNGFNDGCSDDSVEGGNCASSCKNSKCEQRWLRSPAGSVCSCFRGFTVSSDKVSCESIENDTYMLYTAYNTIYRTPPYLMKSLSTNGSEFVSLVLLFDKNLLYFSTIENSDALYALSWMAKSKAIYLVKNIREPTHVAVDWITDNVYFIDESRAINICHADERYCIRLIESRENENITSLAMHFIFKRVTDSKR